MKFVLKTEVTGFIGGFEVRLKNHYGGGCVIKTTSGNNLIISDIV